jgi:hypothetical protein
MYALQKNLSDNENINWMMPSFLWQLDNLPNRASKIKQSLTRHDIHLPRASVKLHLWTSLIYGWNHSEPNFSYEKK